MKNFKFGELIYYNSWNNSINAFELKFGIVIKVYISKEKFRKVKLVNEFGSLEDYAYVWCYKLPK